MEAKVAIYDTQKKALQAVKLLDKSGFPLKQVSLIGKAEVVDEDFQISSPKLVKGAPMVIGASAGVLTGLLTGLGVFAIPGFGFLYGAGAVIGIIAGFDIGIISGGIMSILVTLGIKKDAVVKYEEHLKNGKFMLVVNGSTMEIKKAEKMLHSKTRQLSLEHKQDIVA